MNKGDMLTRSDSLAFGGRWNSTLGTVEPPLTATSLQRPLCFVPEGKSPYIGSLQRPLYSVPKVTVREVQLYQNLLFFDCIRSHGHCLLQEYSHEYAACKSDIVIVWSSSLVRLARYICDIIHPTDLTIPNSIILFITGVYWCTSFTRSRSFPEFSIAVRKDWKQ